MSPWLNLLHRQFSYALWLLWSLAPTEAESNLPFNHLHLELLEYHNSRLS